MAGAGIEMADPDLTLSDGDFRRLANLVHEASGIHLAAPKRELLKARVGRRMSALGLRAYADYLKLVSAQGSDGELRALLDAVSTNKTEFFREASHFDHLASVVVPQWLAAGADGPLRVWSAACSSGEEAYTLAMVLDGCLEGSGDFKVLGTDISTRMLDKALAGTYDEAKVAGIPADLRRKYMRSVDPGQGGPAWLVGDLLRARTSFGRLNLNLGALPFDHPLDVVFCRNVMIYFDPPTQEALVAKISGALKPGGWLYTGLSESLLTVKHRLKSVAPSVYRKPK